METSIMKEQLINKISSLKDKGFIEDLYQLLFKNSDQDNVFNLSAEQKRAVAEAREQYRKGEIISNEEIQSTSKKWLEE